MGAIYCVQAAEGGNALAANGITVAVLPVWLSWLSWLSWLARLPLVSPLVTAKRRGRTVLGGISVVRTIGPNPARQLPTKHAHLHSSKLQTGQSTCVGMHVSNTKRETRHELPGLGTSTWCWLLAGGKVASPREAPFLHSWLVHGGSR